VVEEFADLVAIHRKLVDARAQKEHLAKLPELSAAIKKTAAKIAKLRSEKEHLPVYFGEIYSKLWRTEIAAIDQQLTELTQQIKEAKQQQEDAGLRVERCHEEYLQFGGDKIEALQKEISLTKEQVTRVVRDSSHYQADAKALHLPVALEEPLFAQNQSTAATKLADIDHENKQSQDSFATISAEYSTLQAKYQDISQEIAEISARPDSNIPLRYQQLRDELVSSLQLQKEQCVFLGELIDVADQQKKWQGAIERALGGLRTTLAVPQDCYAMVTRWLNVRHTGLHVRVQVVDKSRLAKDKSPRFKDNGYLNKLIWRDHPYKAWLKQHLQRFDLQCVADTAALDKIPFSMTQQGLVQMNKGRFEKKDQHRIDDRRRWCLGFSNKSSLAILNHDQKECRQQLAAAEKLVQVARQKLDAVTNRKTLWQKITTYQWDDINAPYWQKKLTLLQVDRDELARSGGDLDKAKSRWELAKKQSSEIQAARIKLSSAQGGVKTSLKNAKEEQGKAQRAAAQGMPDPTRALLADRVGDLNKADLHQMSSLLLRVEKGIDLLLDTNRNKESRSERIAIGIMSSFSSHAKWQVITVDWQSDIDSLPDYLDHLQHLEEEGLPDLVERFVNRLNNHATQSLAQIKNKLDSERDDIHERIDIINRVLQRTEFHPGSHLKLGSKKEKFPHVQHFDQQLTKVLSQVNSADHDSRFRQLSLVVDILAKASGASTASTLESLRLLDPRYQMSFYAEELAADSGKVLDVLESSSGKSGGEKESFAGTIVAASLAYVLTPDSHDRPVYCTVFLDEAFSNTAEAVSRRVLRVFKELHIHVNLITPYKNLNLARESASSLLIAERDKEKHDSHLCEITWAEIDHRMAEAKEKKVIAEASQLGVELASAANPARSE